ncbi:uncharacterized protein IL334_000824 [Kwoniella shivajii]|uniref:Glycosyltransferase family 69 protein n=1 Tax=Kwoniella shivajii TaxID=564305 RepID=A0ABZ1CQU2_9TREE|nr:hypothetical protein IL334_000824 [Kwoniella shivajii]
MFRRLSPLLGISRFLHSIKAITVSSSREYEDKDEDERDTLLFSAESYLPIISSNPGLIQSDDRRGVRFSKFGSSGALLDVVVEDEDDDQYVNSDGSVGFFIINERDKNPSPSSTSDSDSDTICSLPSNSFDLPRNQIYYHYQKQAQNSYLYPYSYSSRYSQTNQIILSLFIVIGLGWTVGLYLSYPFPTTIPIFIGLLIILLGWTLINISNLVLSLFLSRQESNLTIISRYSTSLKIRLLLSSIFLLYMFNLGFAPIPSPYSSSHTSEYGSTIKPSRLPQEINGVHQKYFIAANLHDNEAVLTEWSDQLIKLIFHLGTENTFVSIYESNSRDSTKELLSTFNNTLENLSISHRIITAENDDHWWPYSTAVERIEYLAKARNVALEPIQSKDDNIRIANHQHFTKILFLNDIWFKWESIIELLDTRYIDDTTGQQSDFGDYDQVCAMDFAISGLYDTWVARDVCGTPMRIFWPYVKDPTSIKKVIAEEPFQVSACWNGVTALDAQPFLYRGNTYESAGITRVVIGHDNTSLRKRGWRMVDNSTYPGSILSPTIDLPIQFRTSNISQCDHSECFLISYDLHRVHSDRPTKIYMNPNVKVAYERKWFKWNNVILKIPMIQFWNKHWSRGYPFMLVDWIWEYLSRRRDYCTWSALTWYIPDRCPALPGPRNLSWNE